MAEGVRGSETASEATLARASRARVSRGAVCPPLGVAGLVSHSPRPCPWPPAGSCSSLTHSSMASRTLGLTSCQMRWPSGRTRTLPAPAQSARWRNRVDASRWGPPPDSEHSSAAPGPAASPAADLSRRPARPAPAARGADRDGARRHVRDPDCPAGDVPSCGSRASVATCVNRGEARVSKG